MCGQYYRRLGIQIATLLWLSQAGYTLSAQTKRFSIRCTGWNAQQEAASIRCWYLDFASEHSCCQRHFYLRMQRRTLSSEARIGRDVDTQVEVATTFRTWHALTRNTNTRSFIYTCWYLHLQAMRVTIRL